jgi:prepilin-type N-terminal cleavage/methylation domain-containing protein
MTLMDDGKNDRRTLASPEVCPSRLSRGRRSGFTILELVVALGILLIASSIFFRLVASTSKLREVNRENAIAADAARVVIEQMRNRPFSDLFKLYNADPADDPGGAGTAPGNLFFVDRLRPLATSPGGLVGEVLLPSQLTEVEVAGGRGGTQLGGGGTVIVEELWLREDVIDDGLGLPRDLNGDNVVDELNHATDYIILPVRVVVRWQGVFSERSLRVVTMLTDFELNK